MKTTQLLLITLTTAASVSLIGCQKEAPEHDHADHDHEHEEAQVEAHDHDHDHEDHGHGHDHSHQGGVAGPNGGRVITSVEPHVEFLVTDDRKVKLTFLDEDLKPIPAAEQTATVFAGERTAPVKLGFVPDGDQLVSDQSLPEGNDFPTVVQLKMAPEAKPVIEKFNLNLSLCPTCDYREYACVCEH
ncbi:MAG: hypothetical protein KDN19_00520 [Verrucomicrobiae bacterium]|nr:hypothetical protein [Verrucomicrobiae bacterium]